MAKFILLLWTLRAQKLVVQAPYSFTRNPLAFGLINFYVGISIAIGAISPLVIVLIFSTLILAYIKFIEVKELAQRFGNDYLAYKESTPFLFPRRSNS